MDSLISRRNMLGSSALGMGALSLQSLFSDDGLLAADSSSNPAHDQLPHFPGTAKRVIHFFLNGGPSHVDTFDPKPELARHAGKLLTNTLTTERKTGAAFPSPFKFRKYGESGLEVSELFSRTAEHIDDIAVIRSMYAQVPNHEPSLMLMNCGDSIQARPSVGSWVMYGLGSENQNLPGFVAMCPGGLPIKDNENWQAGFLPGAYQGTYINSQHRELANLIENIEHPHISSASQRQQLKLLQNWNQKHAEIRKDDRLEARIHAYELAFRMQIGAAEVFDLNQEPKHIQEMYGNGVHGRQTLIARRLLERGVRYVQLWHGAGQPWDNHDNIADNHRKLADQLDPAISALLTDLKLRGMLEDTLVIWGGEFGRTPTVELTGSGNSKLGRDHNHWGFSIWMAGGGIKGGTIYGATDEIGFKAVENPTSVPDLHATILHTLGFDHERLTYRYAGRDFRLTDVHGRVIQEILK
ncbi:DUF1501 domain-containing protein [Rubinisphaera sp.]|uniref:DUF1501 domain-containing protein n=1 Tax=Rubinisphaera sp. TaxID=2024857 RepID=UPI000C10AC37|nr:DUF1501 domain-containing protein [Rubinisphaera sp.]MBV09948.1 sulfatase [Rubinisphaera sp.]|tara:strand:- start:378 stop:1781 length:1404 start_codon:yes stop_codon:yes gene_type:complete